MLSSFLQWKDREQRSSSIQRSAFKGQEKDASVYSKGNFVHVEGKKKSTKRAVKHWDRKPEKYYAVFILGDFQFHQTRP